MDVHSEFEQFAIGHLGISSLALYDYQSIMREYVYSMTPMIIEERQLNVQAIDVFSRLMVDRIIFLGLPIDDYVANIVNAQLLFLESADPNKPIHIYINSPGGSVYDGLGIYDVMQYIQPEVSTVCTGLAASFAALLLCAGASGSRIALPHARVMIHQPLGGARGQASDIAIVAEQYLKIRKELYEIIAHHSGQSIEKIEKDSDRDYWMTANEAKDYGLIDQVLSIQAKPL
jgi:ATP-dependent Clp protease protease subunit